RLGAGCVSWARCTRRRDRRGCILSASQRGPWSSRWTDGDHETGASAYDARVAALFPPDQSGGVLAPPFRVFAALSAGRPRRRSGFGLPLLGREGPREPC